MKSFIFHVSLQEQVIFFKNLSVMVKAGMPLLDSIRRLQTQTKSRSMRKILEHLTKEVANGQFLSASMEHFRNIFGNFAISIIRVGEASGILSENLNYLAEELKKRRALRQKVISALIYPIIIILATLGITTLLTVYIFPKILPIFKSLNVDLPFTTRTLIAASDFLINYGFYLALGIIAAIIAWWLILRVYAIRFIHHRFILYLPLAGKISQNYNMANFCRTLGLLLRSDIKVVEALSITAKTLTNLVYRKEFEEISKEIASGNEISRHLERRPDIFPLMLSQLIAIGETTGNLSETLLYLSDFYETELDEITKNLSSVLEPLLMIVMGGVVGFIAVSIITPIYEVTQYIKK